MTLPWRAVSAADIDAWCRRYEARSRLPELLRRLVHETIPPSQLHRNAFDAGGEVQRPGWDGLVEAASGNQFVPAGMSGWELGTEARCRAKAETDQEKRRAEPSPLLPSESTYVAVTARRWTGKREWEGQRRRECVWADVKAYDASDLEQWLEIAPRTHLWFASLLGQPTRSVEDATEFWDRWTGRTEPSLTAVILTLGRAEAVSRVREWLLSPPSLLTVQADTHEEALAFAIAVVQQLPPAQSTALLDRCAVVTSPDAVPSLTDAGNALLLLGAAEFGRIPPMLAQKNHVLEVVDRLHRDPSALVLPRQDRYALGDALKELGLPPARASRLGQETGGSITALRRLLARGTGQIPDWAAPAEARPLVAALLAGSWDEGHPADREVVERIGQGPYAEVVSACTRWLHVSDPPLKRIANIWSWVSRADAWRHLARFVSAADLETFSSVALNVLGEKDPRFDLQPNERWLAEMKGKVSAYSPALRRGFVETVAMLGALTESREIQDGARASDRAGQLVYALLHNTESYVWASLADFFPDLAEAAPAVFLSEVEAALGGENRSIRALFEEENGALFPVSHHTGLLWALEGLSWAPDLLPRVAVLLGRLARIDPGGRLANRPLASLRHILLGWFPQTAASLGQRIAALDALLRKEPDVGWKLLLALLPQPHDSSFPQHRPRWRDWADQWREGVPGPEYWQMIEAVGERLVARVGADREKWTTLLEGLSSIPQRLQDEVLRSLAQVLDSNGVEVRVPIWAALRGLLHRHRRHPDGPWVLPPLIVARIAELYSRCEPTDMSVRFAWLFDWHPPIPEPTPGDWEADERAVHQLRQDAVREVIAIADAEALLDFVATVKEPGLLGQSVGEAELSPAFEQVLLATAAARGEQATLFERAFVSSRFLRLGWPWAERLFVGRGSSTVARLACGLPFGARTWSAVAGMSRECHDEYWRLVPAWRVDDPVEDGAIAIRGLLGAGRPWAAIELADMLRHQTKGGLPTAALAVEILEAAIAPGAERRRAGSMDEYHVQQLFDLVRKSGEVERSRLSRLEWAFLPLLRHSGTGPATLQGGLAGDGLFFAEVVAWIWKPAGERDVMEAGGAEGDDEWMAARGRRAYELLSSWHVVPGTNEDGSLDGDKLRAWVVAARQACAASDRAGIGDVQIGRILAHSPAAADGTWPALPVRELLEEIESVDLEDGLRVELYNKRGVVSRGHGQGGAQERALAVQYRSWAEACGAWTRIAAVLRQLADGYEGEARLEDLRDMKD